MKIDSVPIIVINGDPIDRSYDDSIGDFYGNYETSISMFLMVIMKPPIINDY